MFEFLESSWRHFEHHSILSFDEIMELCSCNFRTPNFHKRGAKITDKNWFSCSPTPQNTLGVNCLNFWNLLGGILSTIRYLVSIKFWSFAVVTSGRQIFTDVARNKQTRIGFRAPHPPYYSRGELFEFLESSWRHFEYHSILCFNEILELCNCNFRTPNFHRRGAK